MKYGTLLAAVLVVMSLASSACARTWRVELNGSGDFTEIQPAVDAAAPGDTILIGPGRFDTFHPITAPAWTEDTIVSVLKDDLTFIGSGQDVTILGPTTYFGPYADNPKVFCSFGGYDGRIERMTIENVENGVYWIEGTVVIAECTFRAPSPNFQALFLAVNDGAVRDCAFDQVGGGSAFIISNILGNIQHFEIADCAIQGADYGVSVGYGAQNIVIRGCTISGAFWGLLFEGGSTGQIDDCSITGSQDRSAVIMNYSVLTIRNSAFEGGRYGLNVNGYASVDAEGIIISSTTDAALYFYTGAQATINGSHILPASGLAFNCFSYSGTPVTIDLTGNYWGTTDSTAIATSIHDSQDDPALHCTVLFEPYANGPVPTETTTWGELKVLFR